MVVLGSGAKRWTINEGLCVPYLIAAGLAVGYQDVRQEQDAGWGNPAITPII
jgi:hypothetical protein